MTSVRFFQVGCQSCAAVGWSDVVAAARSKERSKRFIAIEYNVSGRDQYL